MKIEEKVLGTIDSKNIISYNMINSKGFEVRILNYSGVITDILFKKIMDFTRGMVVKSALTRSFGNVKL